MIDLAFDSVLGAKDQSAAKSAASPTNDQLLEDLAQLSREQRGQWAVITRLIAGKVMR